MKKILMIAVLLLCFCLPAYAAEVDDAQKLLASMKELRFTVESGVNLVTYRDTLTKTDVEYRKFLDKYPSSPFQAQADKVINPYKEANYLWQRSVYERTSSIQLESAYGQNLIRKYPSLMTTVKIHEDVRAKDNAVIGRWFWYSDTMQELWRIAAKEESTLHAQIESK